MIKVRLITHLIFFTFNAIGALFVGTIMLAIGFLVFRSRTDGSVIQAVYILAMVVPIEGLFYLALTELLAGAQTEWTKFRGKTE